MLTVRYDPASRTGFVRVREGRGVRTRKLSSQATAEYGRRGQLLTIAITDLDPAAADFLRTADEETLLRVIAAQAGNRAAGPRPPASQDAARARPRHRDRRP